MVDIASKSNTDELSELIKKLFFIPLSFLIIKANYDYSLSVGVILDCYQSFYYIISILIPTAILTMIYFVRKENYKYCFYIFLISSVILIVDAIFVEHADMAKVWKFISYYPVYIVLTYFASFIADLASADFRMIKNKVEESIENIFDPFAHKIAEITRSTISHRKDHERKGD
jgi:hypothetical protein